MPMEEPPKGAQPRMGRNLLPGKADSDCFLPVMSSNEIGHCLGTRYVGVLRAFFHVYTQAHPKQRPLATAWIGLQRGEPPSTFSRPLNAATRAWRVSYQTQVPE